MGSVKYEKMLSVIVPVYNAEKYLRECVDSIIAQTLEDREIILVDDGSTDSSGDICDEYAAGYDDIKVIHGDNHGLVAARKKGVSVSSGRYIGFVDSDDWVDADMYESMIGMAVENSLDMVCCGLCYEKNGKSVQRRNEALPGTYDHDAIQKEILPRVLAFGTDYSRDRQIEPHIVDKLIRHDIIEQAIREVDDRIRWGEDAISVVKCVMLSHRIGVMKECGYHYRIHNDSMCFSTNEEVFTAYPIQLRSLLEMSGKEPKLYSQIRYYAIHVIREMLTIGLNVRADKFWLFPYEDFEPGRSVALYGAGNVGTCYYRQLMEGEYFARVDLFDTHPSAEHVKGPDELTFQIYDKIVISVDKEETARAIKGALMAREIPEDKIYWKKPRWVRDTFYFNF